MAFACARSKPTPQHASLPLTYDCSPRSKCPLSFAIGSEPWPGCLGWLSLNGKAWYRAAAHLPDNPSHFSTVACGAASVCAARETSRVCPVSWMTPGIGFQARLVTLKQRPYRGAEIETKADCRWES
jgi:hypothetical protein